MKKILFYNVFYLYCFMFLIIASLMACSGDVEDMHTDNEEALNVLNLDKQENNKEEFVAPNPKAHAKPEELVSEEPKENGSSLPVIIKKPQFDEEKKQQEVHIPQQRRKESSLDF